MKTYWGIIALCCSLFSGTTLASQCPANNNINNPTEIIWEAKQGYFLATLEFGEATFAIGNETITTRAYRQEGGEYSIPGPTLRMEAGQKYVLKYKNLLPYEPASMEHNVLKDPNVSNLHTHGLHISGATPGDDVTRMFEGGYGGDYVYDIPADHMGGSYWYHAHHHGSSFLQISGGAFGMIVVNDKVSDNIPPNVTAMLEKQIVVGFLDTGAAGAGGDTLLGGSLPPGWTVNGKKNGNLCVPANTWQRWRVLLADRDAGPKTVSVGSQCEVALMARDGVWRTRVPLSLATNSLSLTGASRADIAVRCSNDSTLSVNGQVVGNIIVDSTLPQNLTASPYADAQGNQWLSQRPGYLRDLRVIGAVHKESITMGARTINGSKFDHDVPTLALNTGSVQEWAIKGASQHPFHLHIYHVQMKGNCGEYEDGEYYDVVAGSCTVRFDLNPTTSTVYQGRTIMHCHILEHEDQGAMGWLNVLGSNTDGSIGAPTFPLNSPAYSPHYSLDGTGGNNPPNAPTNLLASAFSSSQININWTDNASDETGFEIEFSESGGNYNLLASLGADTIAFSHTGLTPNTNYAYRVRALNANGYSAYSNTSNVTTPGVTAPTAVTVSSITVTTVSASKGLKYAQATVIIADDQGGLVSGATVTGNFTGTFTETVSGTTDSNGRVILDTLGTTKGTVAATFCVTQVTHPVLAGFSGSICSSL